jgi:hypothetical protein
MHRTQGTCLHVEAEHPCARGNQPLGHIPSLAKAESKFVPRTVQPPMSRRAVRPAATRARAVCAEGEPSQTQDVQRPLGTCTLHSSSGTLSSMALARFFRFGVESKLCCGRSEAPSESNLCGSAVSVLGSPVHLARMPSKCLPRKNAPSNPSIEGTFKRLRFLPAPHVKR